MQLKEEKLKKSTVIKGRLLNIFLHFCRRSTFHGLNQIANAKNIRQRAFWILICSSASLGFFINIYYLIDKYLEVPILTNVYQNYESFTFPDVSFCFTNPIYFPPRQTESYEKLFHHYNEYLNFTKVAHQFFTHRVKLADYLFMQKSDYYSHQPSTTIVSCTYMGFNCSYEHFEVRHIYAYGVCYTFNATKILHKPIRNLSSIPNIKSLKPNFQIVIYKSVDMPPEFSIDPFEDVTMPSGVVLMLHEEDTFPSLASGFILDMYSQVNLKITKKKHLNINNKCKTHRPKYKYVDIFSNTSNMFTEILDDCVFVASQKKVMDYCQCVWPRYPPINVKSTSIRFCTDGNIPISKLRTCLRKTYSELINNDLKECYKDLCEHKIFETVISQSKFPAVQEKSTHLKWLEILSKLEANEIQIYSKSDLKYKALKNDLDYFSDRTELSINKTNQPPILSVTDAFRLKRTEMLDEDFIDRNFAMIRIVPSSYFIDKVEEMKEYPLSRLASDVGGCVGLWVGASLITIFEFLDLLFDFSEVSFPKEHKEEQRDEKRKHKKSKKINKEKTQSKIKIKTDYEEEAEEEEEDGDEDDYYDDHDDDHDREETGRNEVFVKNENLLGRNDGSEVIQNVCNF